MKKHIVLLSGKQGSGKSTVQEGLMRRLPQVKLYDWIAKFNFADALYELHDVVLDKLRTLGVIHDTKKDGVLLQLLGTEWGRRVLGENIWAKILKNKIVDFNLSRQREDTLVIVADCRFKNEFDAFPEALRVRLYAPESVRRNRTTSWRENTTHLSEMDLDDYEFDDKFDLYLDTSGVNNSHNPGACVELILAKLQKNNWLEKRK